MFDAEGYGSIGVAAEPGYGKPEAVRVALTRKGQRALCVGRSDLLAQQQQKGISTSASSCHGPPLTQLRNDAGFMEDAAWSDDRGWFRLQLWRPILQI